MTSTVTFLEDGVLASDSHWTRERDHYPRAFHTRVRDTSWEGLKTQAAMRRVNRAVDAARTAALKAEGRS